MNPPFCHETAGAGYPGTVPVSRRPYTASQHTLERALGVLYTGGWAARLWALVPGATRVGLIEHTLAVPTREKGRPPLRIAFASDLHLGPTTPHEVLDAAFDRLKAANADVLALGGDYVFLGATKSRVKELQVRVAEVPARVKLAVLGNHDFWARPERLEDSLTQAGVRVLVDDSVRLPPPHDDVAIVGLDDPLTSLSLPDKIAQQEAVDAALARVADVPIKVALCHSPDGYPEVKGRGVQLLLCGHTHGGHIALPGYRPLWVPSPHGRLWPYGRHEVDGLTLFVSRGVGGSLVPMRTYAPPDVCVFTIERPSL
jgi:predicted MPP superfamily phosphohydrolase